MYAYLVANMLHTDTDCMLEHASKTPGSFQVISKGKAILIAWNHDATLCECVKP